MAYEFKRLADVEALGEVPENATVLAEVNGSIKRIPGKGLGGGNSVILTQVGGSSGSAAPMDYDGSYGETFEANMDFTEALEAYRAGAIGGIMVYVTSGGASESSAYASASSSSSTYFVADIAIMQDATDYFGMDCLAISTSYTQKWIFWTANGISTEEPYSGGVVE